MTYNVHQLLHAVNWEPLWCFSRYAFESGNGKIIKKVKAAKGVIYQICKIIRMSSSLITLKKYVEANYPESRMLDYVNYLDKKETISTIEINSSRYFGVNRKTKKRWVDQLQLSASSKVYLKLIKKHSVYKPCRKIASRQDNSYIKTSDGNFYRILEFIVDIEQRRAHCATQLIKQMSLIITIFL